MNKLDEKTVDELLDALYGESEVVEKSETSEEEVIEKADAETIKIAEKKRVAGDRMEVTKDKEELADEAMKKVKKTKKDEEGDGGRPKEVQDVPENDEDGQRAKGYDHVQMEQKKTPDISEKGTMVKSQESDDVVAISKEEYAAYAAFKKSQEAAKEEELKKAQEDKEQEKLQKAISAVTSGLREENAELRKSLEETQALIKSLASKPVQRKSVSNVQAIEKSFADVESAGEAPRSEPLSKSQVLDAAEELVKSKEFTVEDVIELENTGFILNPAKRQRLEEFVNKK